jgi:hypothetical protein
MDASVYPVFSASNQLVEKIILTSGYVVHEIGHPLAPATGTKKDPVPGQQTAAAAR